MTNPNWETEARYPAKPTPQRNTAVGDEIADQLNANRVNDDANARQSNDTPKAM